MMKKILLTLVALIGLALPAKAAWSPTFVSIATFTPTGVGTTPWSFKNTSSAVEVRIERIEVGSCSSGTVTGGLNQFWLYAASSLTNGGISQISTYSYSGADVFPASVQASTGPVSVTIENKGGMQLPLLPPFLVNNDETATANFSTVYELGSDNRQPIILPRGGTRGLVLKQMTIGGSQYTDGCVYVRTVFTTNAR